MKQNRPLILLPGLGGPATTRLAWAAVLAALLVALVGVLVFIGSQRSSDLVVVPPSATPTATASSDARPSPSANPSPSPAPSLEPSPSAEPAAPLERGIATVLVDDLRVRSEPGVNTDSELLEPLLATGQSVYVVDGPIEADGYTWYAVAPRLPDGMLYGELPKGWVAVASRDGEPWLSSISSAPCPTGQLTVEALIALTKGAGCFGSTELHLLATPVAVDVLGGHCFPLEDEPNCTDEPPWLIAPSYVVQPHEGWVGSRPTLWAAAAEDATLAEWDGSNATFTLTGHYDDPAAATCRIYDTVTNEPLVTTPEQAIEDCRQTFVVTEAVNFDVN